MRYVFHKPHDSHTFQESLYCRDSPFHQSHTLSIRPARYAGIFRPLRSHSLCTCRDTVDKPIFESLMIPSAVIGSLAHIPGSLSRFKYLPMLSPVVREASVVAPTVSNVKLDAVLKKFLRSIIFCFFIVFSDCKFIAVE